MPDTAVPPVGRWQQRSWTQDILTSGWLWGLVSVCLFYAAIPYIPDSQGLLQRYFAAHWIEYTSTGLFFVGMATLAVRALSLPSERDALSAGWLDDFPQQTNDTPMQTAERVVTHLRQVARRQLQTGLARRILDVCQYVRGRRGAEGLEGQLSYLADSAAVRLHGSYAFVRTITWAIPILGFLGTVIGITLSIANITPDQLESSLNEVTGGLAVAFDTTALSLALSMVLVFSTFLIERQEQQVLDAVEDQSMQTLVALFPAGSSAPQSPLIAAEQRAAEQLLSKTEELVAWQMQAWQSSLESVRERWLTTLQQQQAALDAALESGFRQTLVDHAEQLAATRSDFVATFGLAAEAIRDQLSVTSQVLHEQQVQHLQQMQQSGQQLQTEMAAMADRQVDAWAAFSDQMTSEIRGWQTQLGQANTAMTEQLGALREQGDILLRIVDQDEQLIRLEERLTQNLNAVRVVESLDETLLSLNAAVSLLSSKTRNKAA